MALIQPPAPAAAQAAFAAGLPSFLSGPAGLGSPSFAGIAPKLPTAAAVGTSIPAQVQLFGLSLKDAAAGTIAPVSMGWQIFAGELVSPSPGLVMGTVTQNRATKAWKLISVSYGPLVASQLTALVQLQSQPAVAEQNYEVRMLSVPGANVLAFWLSAQTPEASDLFVPHPAGAQQIIPALRGPVPLQKVSFLSSITQVAVANLAMATKAGA